MVKNGKTRPKQKQKKKAASDWFLIIYSLFFFLLKLCKSAQDWIDNRLITNCFSMFYDNGFILRNTNVTKLC